VAKAFALAVPPDLNLRTRWYIYIRWFLLLAIALPGILSLFIVDGFSKQVARDFALGMVAISTNLIFYLISRLLKSPRHFKHLAISLIAFDIFLVSGVIFINGGIESRNPILYVMPILISAAILGRPAIYKTTLAAIVAYDLLIILDYFNIIHSVGAFDPTLRSWFSYVINTVAAFTAILLIIGATVDFITRLLADKEKQISENLDALKQAQAIANFGSWEWDIKKDKVYWSEELFRIFNVKSTSGEINFDQYINKLHPDDRKQAQDAIKKALKKQKPYSFEHRIIRSNGALRYLYGRGQPILDNKGKVIKLIGTAQDITSAKLLEEARNDFVALASHQLRTPATGVKQYLGLLLEGYAGSLSKDQENFVRIAYDSNDRQLSIVDDLLNVAQIDSGNLRLRKTEVDLIPMFKEIIKEEALKFENKKQTLSFTPSYKQLIVPADARRVRMVIENVLDNAHKYTPKKGHIKIILNKKSGDVCITISDDGIGMAKKDIAKIFKKFVRVNNPQSKISEGTGLGLYLAKRIVKLHSGRIVVESSLSKGTKFMIYLPLKSK
jgi:signal transduction histidine kinase